MVTRTVTVADTTAPVITLNGDATITLLRGETYTELGATVTDYETLTAVIGGDTVDPNTPGTYTITYNATDSSGNAATQVTRTVIIPALSDGQNHELEGVNIYAHQKMLYVNGIVQEQGVIKVYNLFGQQVFTETFEGYGENNFDLSAMSTGIYITAVKTALGTLVKKIVLH